MEEHILIQIIGRDKAVSAKIIEELHDGAHLAILRLAGGRHCRRERLSERRQIFDRPAMFIGAERYGHDIAGQESYEAEPVQCRAVKKYFFVTDAHETVFSRSLYQTSLPSLTSTLPPASCFIFIILRAGTPWAATAQYCWTPDQ